MAQVEFSPDELDGFAALLDDQDTRLDALSRYADVTCRAVDDLGDLREPFDALGRAHAQVFAESQSGLGHTAELLTRAAREYRARDLDAATTLDRLHGGFHSSTLNPTGSIAPDRTTPRAEPSRATLPAGSGVPGRTLSADSDARLTLPVPEVHRHERLASAEDRLAGHADLWHRLTRDDLPALVTAPLAGPLTGLPFLATAYATLGAGTSVVLADLGTGVPTWRTPAGAEFDGHLRGWRAGLAGVAELDRTIAAELARASATVLGAAERVLDLADELLAGPLARLRALVYPDRSLRIWLVPAQTHEIYTELRRGLDLLAAIGAVHADVAGARTALADQLGQWRGACESLLPSAGRRA
ncbi:hypothetical protein R8Z50_34880 [Longispora sp. K20-0274]|uniref:hypothetical protein n=1 Tax=Longispora sp. K20-0274 TaxID=3088255 RepID=UPI00399BD4D0